MILQFRPQFQEIATLDHESRRLAIVVGSGIKDGVETFYAISVDTRIGALSIDAVLDDHAHQNLGAFATADEARQAAERFAVTWKTTVSKRCSCGPIVDFGGLDT